MLRGYLILIRNFISMNILVTGANGQLGSQMRVVAAGSGHNYIFTDVAELDVTNYEEVCQMVSDRGVDVVINCAGYTNVDKAEDDAEQCTLLNANACENLAKAMCKVGGTLIHISSDYVFGGGDYNLPCKEEQVGSPTGVYGLTKLKGEEAIKSSGVNYIIIRTAWMHSEFGKNFVKTMLALTSAKAQDEREAAGKPRGIKVVFDQVGTPTYAYDLAMAISHIVESGQLDKKGIYHYSNEGVCSWYDFAKMIAQMAGHSDCDIRPCHSNEFPSKVVRPSYSVLDKTKIKDTFGIKVPYWVDSLRVCIDKIKGER